MEDNKKEIIIREFNEEKDIELVGKLEKSCELLSNNNNKGFFPFASIMGDPLCRIRFFPLHVLLVAELRENGEVVGVVRGCIKHVGTKFGEASVNLGCILGLRVSPTHRRMGIGLKLVKSIEEWLAENGAHYTFLATEKNNTASTNLFTTKCNYVKFSSLHIFAQPSKKDIHISHNYYLGISIEKLSIEQAISFYKDKLRRDVYPLDMESILREKLNLGTWVVNFNEEKEKGSARSWVVFSVWNSCEACNIHRKGNNLKFHCFNKLLNETLIHAREKIFAWLSKKMPSNRDGDDDDQPFGFLFLFGLHGEGERLGELMKCAWGYASRLAIEENIKDCKVIMTELGVGDSLFEFMPRGEGEEEGDLCISRVEDVWYLKKVYKNIGDQDIDGNPIVTMMGQEVGNVFIDPRDF